MAISSNDLMLAILSMDAYNQGYNAGIVGVGNQLGTATQKQNVALPVESQAAGFSGVAYNWNGQTIISYGGTNNESFFPQPCERRQ